MAGHGPAPKERHIRDRNDVDLEVLEATGELFGPPLPEGYDWHPQTLALWDSLRRSPLLADEPELGWQFLIDTALMHSTMWAKSRWEFASEVRLRLAKYGATPEDRMRLKIKIKTPQPEPRQSGTVADIASRRARLVAG